MYVLLPNLILAQEENISKDKSVINENLIQSNKELKQNESPNSFKPYVLFNQKLINGLRANLELDDVEGTYRMIFSQLPDSVFVYPTENYYYFIFYNLGRCFWGNFRLGVEERDSGFINFVYWEFNDDPKSPDAPFWMKRFSKESGVNVVKRSNLKYEVSYQNKTVLFQLHEIEQKLPVKFSLPDDEEFIFRTCDESGFQFFLIYKRTHPHFMWVLNEEQPIPGILDSLTDSILVDRTSGFAFYLDRECSNRKILIGVRAQNVRRNNYWDGPFDQLADNYIPHKFAEYLQEAYPYSKGRINRFGMFTDEEGSRMAISPYFEYETLDELIEGFRACNKEPSDEFFPCINYDYKVHF